MLEFNGDIQVAKTFNEAKLLCKKMKELLLSDDAVGLDCDACLIPQIFSFTLRKENTKMALNCTDAFGEQATLKVEFIRSCQ